MRWTSLAPETAGAVVVVVAAAVSDVFVAAVVA